MKIYIESSVVSYAVAESSRDIIQQARIEITREWWRGRTGEDEYFISDLVIAEVARGDEAMSQKRLAWVMGFERLEFTESAKALADGILGAGLIPPKAAEDALHIAMASVYEMDVILTWNFRHIANARQIPKIQKIVSDFGYQMPLITTPEEI